MAGVAAIAMASLASREPRPVLTEADPSLTVTVDLSERKLRVVRDGEVEASYAVAVGTRSHPTPKGSFSIRRITWNPRWVPPDEEWARDEKPREPGDPRNPMGKVKIFFQEPDYYIHGTRDTESLGTAASHGCLRLSNSNAIEVARAVMAAGGASRPPSWFRRVINRIRSTEEVRLARPVQIRITA